MTMCSFSWGGGDKHSENHTSPKINISQFFSEIQKCLIGDIGTPQEGFLYNRRTIRIQCYPIYSLILALGNPVVDILSLDIEGAELQVPISPTFYAQLF